MKTGRHSTAIKSKYPESVANLIKADAKFKFTADYGQTPTRPYWECQDKQQITERRTEK